VVLENDGSRMSVRTALQRINEILDEVLTDQEGEFDSDTRFASRGSASTASIAVLTVRPTSLLAPATHRSNTSNELASSPRAPARSR